VKTGKQIEEMARDAIDAYLLGCESQALLHAAADHVGAIAEAVVMTVWHEIAEHARAQAAGEVEAAWIRQTTGRYVREEWIDGQSITLGVWLAKIARGETT
jgi:hypothetical protein